MGANCFEARPCGQITLKLSLSHESQFCWSWASVMGAIFVVLAIGANYHILKLDLTMGTSYVEPGP